MSQTPIFFDSTDASAPQLAGTAGALNTVVHAILVAGYGAKSGCGWTREFVSGSVAVWKNNPTRGTGNVIRIDDAGSGPGGAREALVRMGRTATDVNTLTETAPSVAQLTNGIVFPKSVASSATTRAWRAVACERWCYLFVDMNSDSNWCPLFFGDLMSWAPSDPRGFAVFGSEVTTQASNTYRSVLFNMTQALTSGPATSINIGGWLLSNYAQVPGGIRCNHPSDMTTRSAFGSLVSGLPTYPHPVAGGVLLDRCSVMEGVGIERGWLPNCYAPRHGRALSDQQVLTSVSRYPGDSSPASMRVFNFRCAGGSATSGDGQVCIDTTNSTN